MTNPYPLNLVTCDGYLTFRFKHARFSIDEDGESDTATLIIKQLTLGEIIQALLESDIYDIDFDFTYDGRTMA